jgi:hypothetical protein
MVTVSRRVLLPLLAPILLRQLSTPRLHQIQFRPVRLHLFAINHANEEFGMAYPGSKTELPMEGGRT